MSSDEFQKFSQHEVYDKRSGHIFTIYASRNVAVFRKIQTHLRSFLSASSAEEVLGAISLFMRLKTKLFTVKLRRILEVIRLWGLQKKFWAHVRDLYVQKRSCLPWSSDYFGSSTPARFIEKVLGTISRFMHPRRGCLLWSLDAFWKFSLFEVHETVLGAISRFMRPKMKLFTWSSEAFWKYSVCKVYRKSSGHIFTIYASKTQPFAVKFRRILEVFALRSARKCSVRYFTIYASKNEAVWYEVFALRRAWLWAQFQDLCVQKRSCLPWSWDAFWKLSDCEVYRKSSGRMLTIYASKNEAVSREIQRHFGSFLSATASFVENFLGAISRFMRPITKLFDMKLRRILEAIRLWGLQKKFWTHAHDLCVQKRSCFPWNSDAFWKFSVCNCKFCRKRSGRNFTIYASNNEAVWHEVETHFGSFRFARCIKGSWRNFTIYASKNEAVFREVETHFGSSPPARFAEKSSGRSRFVCRANKHSWSQHFVKMLWARFTILHSHIFFLCCWNTLWYSWLSHFESALNLNTFGLRMHPQIVTRGCDFMRSTFKQVLDWHLSHVL